MKKLFAIVLVIACAFALFANAATEKKVDAYPEKAVSIVVPWGAGGGNDLAIRALTQNAVDYLGQPITIVNTPGANATVANFKNTAKSDGYELLMVTMGCFTSSKWLNNVPYSFDDFDILTSVSLQPNFLLVRSDSEFKTLDDFKKAGRPITFASTGATSSTHLLPQELFSQMGVEANGIPYDSGAEGAAAVLGGHCDVYVSAPADATKYSKSGDMRIIGVFESERIDLFPDVPTFKEMGYDLALSVTNYVLAPKGLSDSQLKTLRDAFSKMHDDPDFINFATNSNLPVINFTVEETMDYYNKELQATYDLYKKMGLI